MICRFNTLKVVHIQRILSEPFLIRDKIFPVMGNFPDLSIFAITIIQVGEFLSLKDMPTRDRRSKHRKSRTQFLLNLLDTRLLSVGKLSLWNDETWLCCNINISMFTEPLLKELFAFMI